MKKDISCDELVSYLSDYIDNNLSEELSLVAREHLETCKDCRVVLDSTQQMIFLYREQGKSREIPAQRQQQLYGELLDVFLQSEPDS